jgi:hypothetical protein
MSGLLRLLRREHVDVDRGELARGHALLEEDVELRKRAPRRLGDAEVSVNDAQEAAPGLRRRQLS